MQEQLLCLWELGPEASAAFTDSPCARVVWMLQSSHGGKAPTVQKAFCLVRTKKQRAVAQHRHLF